MLLPLRSDVSEWSNDWTWLWACAGVKSLDGEAPEMLFSSVLRCCCVSVYTCHADVSGPIFLHADCWKSAGGNTFLIKFSKADIFALQPAEWFHMCFFAKSEFSCDQQDSGFLAGWSSFCHQGGEVILTVWITSNCSEEERRVTTWLFKIYFRSNNSDLRKKLHHHWMNFRFLWVVCSSPPLRNEQN